MIDIVIILPHSHRLSSPTIMPSRLPSSTSRISWMSSQLPSLGSCLKERIQPTFTFLNVLAPIVSRKLSPASTHQFSGMRLNCFYFLPSLRGAPVSLPRGSTHALTSFTTQSGLNASTAGRSSGREKKGARSKGTANKMIFLMDVVKRGGRIREEHKAPNLESAECKQSQRSTPATESRIQSSCQKSRRGSCLRLI